MAFGKNSVVVVWMVVYSGHFLLVVGALVLMICLVGWRFSLKVIFWWTSFGSSVRLFFIVLLVRLEVPSLSTSKVVSNFLGFWFWVIVCLMLVNVLLLMLVLGCSERMGAFCLSKVCSLKVCFLSLFVV